MTSLRPRGSASIADLLAAGPTLSFEFFPPKTDEAARKLEKTIHELAPLGPSFVSVTYGAGGSTRDRARDLVEQVRSHPGDFAVGVAAHPELHPRSEGDRASDRRHLAAKLAAADFGITQFFFELDDYRRMMDEL